MGYDATGLLAAVAVLRGVLAAPLIPLPEDPQHGGRGPSGAWIARPAPPWLVCLGPLVALELLDQHRERSVEHRVVVAGHDHVPEQVFRPPQH
jgi:hypothetical protein